MRLETTLPERPGFLHVVPLFNLFALLLLFLLLSPSFILQAGVSVDLPPSRFQMERFRNALVVTVVPGEPVRYYLGRDMVNLEQLGDQLDRRRKAGDEANSTVLLRSDAKTPVAIERGVEEMILHKGYRVVLVGRPTAASGPVEPPLESAR